MNLLLDTHIIMWLFTGDERLSSQALELINNSSNSLLCSVATIWEISLKHAKRPEEFDLTEEKMIQLCNENGILQLPLFFRHIPQLNSLSREENAPAHHDPFDRIMIAQAKTDNLLFVTHDGLLRFYNEPCIIYV